MNLMSIITWCVDDLHWPDVWQPIMYILFFIYLQIFVMMANPANISLKEWGRMYACTVCAYRGSRRQTEKHVVKDHLSDEDVRFKCRLCGRRGTSFTEVKVHLKQFHNVDESHARKINGAFQANNPHMKALPEWAAFLKGRRLKC